MNRSPLDTDIPSNDEHPNGASDVTLRNAQERLLQMLLEFDRICRKHDIHYVLSGGTCLGAVRHGGFIPWDDDVDIDVWHTDYQKLIKILPKTLNSNYCMQTHKTDKGYYLRSMRIVDRNSLIFYGEAEFKRRKITHKGLFIDIFPLDRCFSYRVKKFMDYYFSRAFILMRIGKKTSIATLLAYSLWPVITLFTYGYRLISHFSKLEKISHHHLSKVPRFPRLKYTNVFPPKPINFEGYILFGPAKPHEYLCDLYGDYMQIPPKSERTNHAKTITVNNK